MLVMLHTRMLVYARFARRRFRHLRLAQWARRVLLECFSRSLSATATVGLLRGAFGSTYMQKEEGWEFRIAAARRRGHGAVRRDARSRPPRACRGGAPLTGPRRLHFVP